MGRRDIVWFLALLYVQTRPDQPHNHNMLGEGGGGFRSRFTLYHASIVLATCMLAAKG